MFFCMFVDKTMVSKFYVKGNSGLNKVTLNENDSFELVCETESKPKSFIKIDFDGETLLSKSSTNTLSYVKSMASCSDLCLLW